MKFYIVFLSFCIPSLAMEPLKFSMFPDISEEMLSSFFAREPSLIPIKSVKQDYGFNMPRLTDAHRDVLQACKGKAILEFGPGHGYFMAKALLTGAEVTGVEKSEPAADIIPNTIKEYENYFQRSFDNRFKVLRADAIDAITQLKEQGKTFDLVLGFNFLHLLCPREAKIVLWRIKPLLKAGGEVLFTMNAPSGNPTFVETYLQAKKDKKNCFPGWMMVTRRDTINVVFDGAGRVAKQLGKEKTEFVSSKPLSADNQTSPSFLNPINSIGDLANSHVISDIEQASLRWDKSTVETVFNSFSYEITELYYVNSRGRKFGDLDMEQAKVEAFNLVVRARPKAQ